MNSYYLQSIFLCNLYIRKKKKKKKKKKDLSVSDSIRTHNQATLPYFLEVARRQKSELINIDTFANSILNFFSYAIATELPITNHHPLNGDSAF
jgi:hypothetical protein